MSGAILTAKAAVKLKSLKTQYDDLHALASSAQRRAGELRHAIAFAPPPPDAQNRKPDAMSAEAAEMKVEIDRLQTHAGVQHAKAVNALQLVTQIEHWLATQKPDVRFIDAAPVALPTFQDQNYQEAVGRIRREIAELDGESRNVRFAAPTKKERHEAARKFVDGLVAKARPTVRATHGKCEVTFGNEGTLASNVAVASAIAAWAAPEVFLERIINALDSAEEPLRVMSAEAKLTEMEALRSEILSLERDEEAIIMHAAMHEMLIPRRVMASPLAVLGLEMVTANEKKVAAA